ncbi:hypothetical protein CVU37_02890 [candidate division BRC1 bacterium HGW-BRC1-1]|nr:MAG: hypothetical protein CVU37_02890 [candidate division BRC1 bacterium HGW-BRC1-1]
MAVFVETALFVAFFGAFLFMVRLDSAASGWAMLPHLLINGGVLALLVKRVREGRPPLYWGRFDLMVMVLFAFFIASIYYSEVRGVSYREAALFLDSLGAFLFGRLLFFRRVRLFAAAAIVSLIAAYFLAHNGGDAGAAGALPPDAALLSRLEGIRSFALVFALFLALSFPFLWLRRPSNIVFLVYVVLIIAVFSPLLFQRVGVFFQPMDTSSSVEMRHSQFLTLQTAWSIVQAFPIMGGGVGTYPLLFDAFKPSPAAAFSVNFTSYFRILVEMGVVGLLLALYMPVRLPIYIMRRWRLFPNRQLRMAIVIFFSFTILALVRGLVTAGMFTPSVWLILWAVLGLLMSLVVVRDPMRIFEMPFDIRRANPAADGTSHSFTRHLSGAGLIGVAAVILAALTLLESLPYQADRLARPTQVATAGETIAATDNTQQAAEGQRLERAVRLFPLSPALWIRLANHFQQLAADPLQLLPYVPRIEQAYQRAIDLNPYAPRSYSLLYDLYTQTNDGTKALATLKQGVRNNPNDLILRLMLVRELEQGGSIELAIWHVKQALLRIAPGQTELFIRLAELYELRGRNDQAERWYQYARQVVQETPQTEGRMRRLRENLGFNQ